MNGYDSYFRPAEHDNNPWIGLISEGLQAARDVARGALSEWPYTSPDDPYARRPIDVSVYPPPQPGSLPPQTSSLRTPQTDRRDVTLSKETLMLLVGGVLLFMLGSKRK